MRPGKALLLWTTVLFYLLWEHWAVWVNEWVLARIVFVYWCFDYLRWRDLHFDTCLLLAVGNGNISHEEQILKRFHSLRQLDSFEAHDDFLKSWCNKSLLSPWVLEKSVGLVFCFEILMLFSLQQWLKPEKQIRKQLKRKCDKLQEKLALGYHRFYWCLNFKCVILFTLLSRWSN